MLKLTTSSIAAFLSILGFGYSFIDYSSANFAIASEPILSIDTLDNSLSSRLIKSPLIKVNGVKLEDSQNNLRSYTLAEIQKCIKEL